MKTAGVLALIGFVLVAAALFVMHDLRGWADGYPDIPARIEAARPGQADFTIDDCVPGTITPYATPTPEEYSGSATVTVLTCRSRSSAITIMLAYLALAGGLLFLLRGVSKRK